MDPEQIKAKLERLTVKYEELKKRSIQYNRLVQVGADCLRILLSDGTLDKTITEILKRLKNATGFNCANIRKINMDSDEQPMLHTLYEIISPQSLIKEFETSKIWPLSIFSKEAVKTLTTGKPYGGKVTELPERECSYFKSRKLLFFLAIPVQIKGHLWGIISLEDTLRDWPMDSEEILILFIKGI